MPLRITSPRNDNDMWIGSNVTVCHGVTIGSNVVIGAGAVVTHDIPDNALAFGVPARVVRKIEPSPSKSTHRTEEMI